MALLRPAQHRTNQTRQLLAAEVSTRLHRTQRQRLHLPTEVTQTAQLGTAEFVRAIVELGLVRVVGKAGRGLVQHSQSFGSADLSHQVAEECVHVAEARLAILGLLGADFVGVEVGAGSLGGGGVGEEGHVQLGADVEAREAAGQTGGQSQLHRLAAVLPSGQAEQEATTCNRRTDSTHAKQVIGKYANRKAQTNVVVIRLWQRGWLGLGDEWLPWPGSAVLAFVMGMDE